MRMRTCTPRDGRRSSARCVDGVVGVRGNIGVQLQSADQSSQANYWDASQPVGHRAHHGATFTPRAVARMLIRNNAMKANTTVSLTALPTPAGPPLTVVPM